MKCRCFEPLALCSLLLFARSLATDERELKYPEGCASLKCSGNQKCVKRNFLCKSRPCGDMLYCSRSRKESTKGPPTCDSVRCGEGYICTIKVRRCSWNDKCKQRVARCVSKSEYYEGPASCAGFDCPAGYLCVLRESFCREPPCKLLKSCDKEADVRRWFDDCKSIGCPSEYECFLRRPEEACSTCKHSPDCTITTADELSGEHCRGWVCPRGETCFAEVASTCEAQNCTVTRSCIGSKNSSPRPVNPSFTNAPNPAPKNDTSREPFQNWLRSIGDIVGPIDYEVWLDYLRQFAANGKQFRKWLPEPMRDALLKKQNRLHLDWQNFPYYEDRAQGNAEIFSGGVSSSRSRDFDETERAIASRGGKHRDGAYSRTERRKQSPMLPSKLPDKGMVNGSFVGKRANFFTEYQDSVRNLEPAYDYVQSKIARENVSGVKSNEIPYEATENSSNASPNQGTVLTTGPPVEHREERVTDGHYENYDNTSWNFIMNEGDYRNYRGRPIVDYRANYD